MTELGSCPSCQLPVANANPRWQFDWIDGRRFPTTIFECRCGHAFSNPQPGWDELAPFYGDESQFKITEDRKAFEARVTDRIARLYDGSRFNHVGVVRGGRFLDIGCSLGEMVAAMGRLGMESEGIEPRQAAVDFARSLGLNVRCGELRQGAFEAGRFDRISMFHVLEHVPDPAGLLRECRRILKPDGEIVIGVPNYRSTSLRLLGSTWIGLDPPRHLHQFHLASLATLSERCGLRVVDSKTESFPEHIESGLALWLRRRLLIPRRLTMASKLARPLAQYLAKSSVKSDGGDSVIVWLRKKPDPLDDASTDRAEESPA